MIKVSLLLACLFAVLVLIARPVHAERLTIEGLDEGQRAEILVQAAAMKKGPSANIAETAGEWADIGTKYGMAIAATAKELGIAADDLLGTTVGKVALVLIVWKVMGSDLLGVVVGIPWLLTGFTFWLYAFRRASLVHSVTVEPVEGRFWRKKTVQYHEGDSDHAWYIRWAYFGVLCLICVSSLIMIFSG